METSVEAMLRDFLAEDIGYGDITTDALVDPKIIATGNVICKEPAIVAGLNEAGILLRLVGCESTPKVSDGEHVRAGQEILTVQGPAHSLLKVERTLLNLVTHMTGVATATNELVRLADSKGRHKVRIACTRKTLPGLRYFEKKAVELGGGDTHRLRLDDMVLVKDNHLVIVRNGIADAVKLARSKASFTKKVEVEVTKPSEAVEAAKAGAEIVLLDNMSPEEVKKTIRLLEEKELRKSVLLECSGGIKKENISNYLDSGVDIISTGSITHSAKSIDMNLDLHLKTN